MKLPAFPSSTCLFSSPYNTENKGNEISNIRRRHPVFYDTNVVTKLMPAPKPSFWENIIPDNDDFTGTDKMKNDGLMNLISSSTAPFTKIMNLDNKSGNKEASSGIDISVNFVDPKVGAKNLVEQCQTNKNSEDDASIEHLASILSYFQGIVNQSFSETGEEGHTSSSLTFKARIVSSIGMAGTKCPRWHFDHVPVRLLVSLVGPGCCYIPWEYETKSGQNEVVNRKALNNLSVTTDNVIANNIIVPSDMGDDCDGCLERNSPGFIKRAKEGEVVLLMGGGWEKNGQGNMVKAAPHRSPFLQRGVGRVLLTVDVILPNEYV